MKASVVQPIKKIGGIGGFPLEYFWEEEENYKIKHYREVTELDRMGLEGMRDFNLLSEYFPRRPSLGNQNIEKLRHKVSKIESN